MNSERYRQIQDQERSFQKKCAITGLAVIATSIGAITTGGVRHALYDHAEPSKEIQRSAQNYNSDSYQKPYWDETNVLLILGGVAGLGVGPFIIALPGSQQKVRMGL